MQSEDILIEYNLNYNNLNKLKHIDLYHINTLQKIKVYEIREKNLTYEGFDTYMFYYNNIRYILDTEIIYLLHEWFIKDPFILYKNNTKLTYKKFENKYFNDIYISLEMYEELYEENIDPLILDIKSDIYTIHTHNDNYYDICEIQRKLQNVYKLLMKYKKSSAIIRLPYVYDITKLNIRLEYDTFIILYTNFSYILLNIF